MQGFRSLFTNLFSSGEKVTSEESEEELENTIEEIKETNEEIKNLETELKESSFMEKAHNMFKNLSMNLLPFLKQKLPDDDINQLQQAGLFDFSITEDKLEGLPDTLKEIGKELLREIIRAVLDKMSQESLKEKSNGIFTWKSFAKKRLSIAINSYLDHENLALAGEAALFGPVTDWLRGKTSNFSLLNLKDKIISKFTKSGVEDNVSTNQKSLKKLLNEWKQNFINGNSSN